MIDDAERAADMQEGVDVVMVEPAKGLKRFLRADLDDVLGLLHLQAAMVGHVEADRVVLVGASGVESKPGSVVDAAVDKPIRARALYDILSGVATVGRTADGTDAQAGSPSSPAPAATRATEDAPATGSPKQRRLRILLAEDNPVNQKFACALLDRYGFRYETVDDGVKAVAAVAERDYDVVLMDIQMPNLDGIGATRQIRALPDPVRSAIPIIAMTANALPGDRETYIAAGMDDYVAKPINRTLLLEALDAVEARLDDGADGTAGEATDGDSAAGDAAEGSAATVASGETVLDMPRIAELVETIGAEAFGDLAAMALAEIPDSLATIEQSLGAGDIEATRAEAHNLKSSLGSYGLQAAYLVAERLEHACRANETDGLRETFTQLRQSTEICVDALNSYIRDDLSVAA
jgi:CheY-like chemotaxis protein/HPt (histidine-containing phosphotransfer) domain-containing protein